jgi:hypothetical protein
MRLSNGTTSLFATVFATSRSQAKLVGIDVAPKFEAYEAGADTGIILTPPATTTVTTKIAKPSNKRALTSMALSQQYTTGYVDCFNGYVRGSDTITCASACNGDCCTGYQACYYFTGKLRTDGSCNGLVACRYATIQTTVVNSCKGDYACYNTGYSGIVISISNSCTGDVACYKTGFDGAVGRISNSCNAYRACNLGANQGSIGNLTSSCNAITACEGAGSTSNGTGTIPHSLTSCCNSENGCIKANKDTLPAKCFSPTEVRNW